MKGPMKTTIRIEVARLWYALKIACAAFRTP
jgi:hypothetical protein